MIDTIKAKIKAGWNWVKKKGKEILIWVGIVGIATAAVIYNPYPIEYITAPENNTYKIGVLNYDAVLNEDITAERPLQYKLDDKFISFKPIEMRWDTQSFKTLQQKTAKIEPKKYAYEDVFGKGISLDMNFGERVFQKITKIESLEDLGVIPKDAKFLEIEFEVETNFIIDGWNKYDDFEITSKVRVGDYSYLEPATAWDNYSETICEDVEVVEDNCDIGCVSDNDGCDTCETVIENQCESYDNKIKIKSFLKNDNWNLVYVKQIPVEWLKTAQYPIYTDADIEYGTAETFNNSETHFINIAKLDTDKFIVCFMDIGEGGDGECVAASVIGTDITYGTESPFDTDIYVDTGTRGTDVCALDTDKFAVVYADDGAFDDGYARANTVTYPGGVPTIGTWGTAKEFETGDTESLACGGNINTATDKFVACYNDEADTDTGKCVAMTVSGTTITAGTPKEIDSGTDHFPADIEVGKLDTDKFVTCFRQQDSPWGGACYAGSISTLTITMGGTESITAMNMNDIAENDTDKFVNCGAHGAGQNKTKCHACTVSTLTTTCGDAYETVDSALSVAAATAHDATHFMSTGGFATGQSSYSSVEFVGNTITAGEEEEFESGNTGGGNDYGMAAEFINTDKVVICYQDDGDSDVGKCIIGDVAEEEPPAAEPEMQIIIIGQK